MSKDELGFARIEYAKLRCKSVLNRIEKLSRSTNITLSSKQTLQRLAFSELSFLLSSLSHTPLPSSISLNIGHLESVVHILEQPIITGVSRVCKSIPLPSEVSCSVSHYQAHPRGVHVDIVCTLNKKPVWFIVSDKNPKHISWYGSGRNDKGLRFRIQQALVSAAYSITLKPSSLILFFSRGIDNFVFDKIRDEFGVSEIQLGFSHFDTEFGEELEGDWINVVARSYQDSCILEINIESVEKISCMKLANVLPEMVSGSEEESDIDFPDGFSSLIRDMKFLYSDVNNFSDKSKLLNFDTTALIALVSGISNGGTRQVLDAPESILRKRFKGNYEFVIAQVRSEIQNPIHAELHKVISERRGIVCETVHVEFKELISMCGGPNEKYRANLLLKHLISVEDRPSPRIMGLPTTRKLALKNKVVFGTGDHWKAPTLSANMGFVRAVSQTGLSLFTIEHRPRALTGD